MMPMLLLAAAFSIAIFVMVRGLRRGNPAGIADSLWIAILGTGIFFVDYLLEHHRVGAAIGTGIGMSVMSGICILVRMVVLKEHLSNIRRSKRRAAEAAAAAGPPPPQFQWFWKLFTKRDDEDPEEGGKLTRLDTRMLKMTLNRTTGTLAGKVRRGHLRGRALKSLSFFQLMQLREDCQGQDERSVAVLDTWLDRYVESWRQRAGLELPEAEARTEKANGNGNGAMSSDEARLVLGVGPEAGPDVIKDAHRRLMQRLHPDLGGSTYLAAKVNEARDLLLH